MLLRRWYSEYKARNAYIKLSFIQWLFFYVISHYCIIYYLPFFVYSTHWTVGYRKDLKFRFFSIVVFYILHKCLNKTTTKTTHVQRPNAGNSFEKKTCTAILNCSAWSLHIHIVVCLYHIQLVSCPSFLLTLVIYI